MEIAPNLQILPMKIVLRRLSMALAVVLSLALAPRATGGSLEIWNHPVMVDAAQFEPDGSLEPMHIAATRNSAFSAAVMLRAGEPVTGLETTVSDLTGDGGDRIAAEHVQVRYLDRWRGTYLRFRPPRQEVLLNNPPNDRNRLGVRVTVNVPADAAAGAYEGELTIRADGHAERHVALQVDVSAWHMPDTQDFTTWIDMIQSPDTLALEYDLEMWSEEHWEMIARSMELIGSTGSRIVYIPLLSETNLGNAQSMVLWIERDDGSWEQDYAIMDRYLDLAEEHMGTPKMVVFYTWDAFLHDRDERPEIDPDATEYQQRQQRRAVQRWERLQKGLSVTVRDPETGEPAPGHLPLYTEPEGKELWRPVWENIRERMQRRGLEGAMVLGMITDQEPSREQAEALASLSGDLPWIAHRHPARLRGLDPVNNRQLRDVADVVYEAHVYHHRFQVNPAEHERLHGWKVPELRAYFGRNGVPNEGITLMRVLPEMNITGEQRGLGRLGADYWLVLEDARGRRRNAVYARYPANRWRNLDIECWLLAPGPDGPVSTARLENMREGVQETEARIFIEKILLDDSRRQIIGEELAERAWTMLDERQRALWEAVWPNPEHLDQLGTLGDHGHARHPHEGIWQAMGPAGISRPGYWSGEFRRKREHMAREGEIWFAESGWIERNARLFEVAAEIQERLQ